MANDTTLMLIIQYINRNQDWVEAKDKEIEARKAGVERDCEEARARCTRIEAVRSKALKAVMDARDAGDQLAAEFLKLPTG